LYPSKLEERISHLGICYITTGVIKKQQRYQKKEQNNSPKIISSPLKEIVKEVNVQACLHHCARVHNVVMLVVHLVVGAEDPVEDVQQAVGAQEKYVVPGQVLYVAVTLEDDQLRNDGQCFEVD
jgi:hypothetical protein